MCAFNKIHCSLYLQNNHQYSQLQWRGRGVENYHLTALCNARFTPCTLDMRRRRIKLHYNKIIYHCIWPRYDHYSFLRFFFLYLMRLRIIVCRPCHCERIKFKSYAPQIVLLLFHSFWVSMN